MQEIKFGDVSVTRVVEYHGDAATSPEDITPGRKLPFRPDVTRADRLLRAAAGPGPAI